ncbi:MAG: hypothetical protein KGO02_06270 [Alphaproteobacteria bacterium]|nr:hypothetical protein [Alphaproteobacteria bacterium]
MTRIGVGVGEEFPMEDRPSAGAGPEDADPRCGQRRSAWFAEEWYACMAARRAARAGWRAARAQFRAEQRARRAQYWSNEARRFGCGPDSSGYVQPDQNYTSYSGPMAYGGFGAVRPFLLLGILIAVVLSAIVALISAVPVLVLGLVIAAVLWIAHHGYGRDRVYLPPAPPGRV